MKLEIISFSIALWLTQIKPHVADKRRAKNPLYINNSVLKYSQKHMLIGSCYQKMHDENIRHLLQVYHLHKSNTCKTMGAMWIGHCVYCQK